MNKIILLAITIIIGAGIVFWLSIDNHFFYHQWDNKNITLTVDSSIAEMNLLIKDVTDLVNIYHIDKDKFLKKRIKISKDILNNSEVMFGEPTYIHVVYNNLVMLQMLGSNESKIRLAQNILRNKNEIIKRYSNLTSEYSMTQNKASGNTNEMHDPELNFLFNYCQIILDESIK